MAEKDIAGGLHHPLPFNHAEPLMAFIPQLAAEPFQHGVLRLLKLQEKRFVISAQEKSDAAKRADGADADRLEYEILHCEAVEELQSILRNAFLIHGEHSLKAQPVLDVSLRIQMKDRWRFVHDPHVVLADEMREVVVL